MKWFSDYSELSEGRLVAVNELGEPFFEQHGVLVKVSPETGDRETVGPVTINPISQLDDYWTALSLKKEWESLHGPLPEGCALAPVIPFVLGGEFDVKNLMKLDAKELMDCYKKIREKVSDSQDGIQVSVRVGP